MVLYYFSSHGAYKITTWWQCEIYISQDAVFRLLQLDVLWNVVQRRIINMYLDYTCVWSLNFANMATLRNFDVLSVSKDLIEDLLYLNNTFFL